MHGPPLIISIQIFHLSTVDWINLMEILRVNVNQA